MNRSAACIEGGNADGADRVDLLVVGLGVAALSAAGLAFAIRSTRSRAMTAGPAVAGLTCSVVLLIGLGMTLYGLNLSGNLGR